MKIIADENIPYVNELFSRLGAVETKKGRALTAKDVEAADILLVRSVTPVDQKLLDDSRVKFVGTCTIGVDHLDTQYLESRGITFTSAPGCNANSVVQYVVSALAQLEQLPAEKSVVVVGSGNVGSRVYKMLTRLGYRCRCVDPFLSEADDLQLTDFSAVYDADIICLHTPLTRDGDHPTYHMLGEQELRKLKQNTVLINAGRGAVIDNAALKRVLVERQDLRVVLDVWENEPDIDKQLLKRVALGTPHIAGYSFEGRLGGSLMIFDKLCSFLQIEEIVARRICQSVTDQAFGENTTLEFSDLRTVIHQAYSINKDFTALQEASERLSESFDELRKSYRKRREFSHFTCENVPPEDRQWLTSLGFVIGD